MNLKKLTSPVQGNEPYSKRMVDDLGHGFAEKLKGHGISPERCGVRVLQVNIGRRCNQSCVHCHVNGGPNVSGNMELPTVDRLLELLRKAPGIETVDITGGAPELNPNFRYFVQALRDMKREVIVRSNLTVLFESGQEDTPLFLAENQVRIIASLPCYLETNVSRQRGNGTFKKSILALRILNRLGYGLKGSRLQLHLVYNPTGAYLPPDQKALESEYKTYLRDEYGIEFNHLFTITNMPINRCADWMESMGELDGYMKLLAENFNPQAAKRVMCKNQISVRWDGQLYDCDFNQALNLTHPARSIWEIEDFTSIGNSIIFDGHCFGCTAGAGSSCKGALT